MLAKEYGCESVAFSLISSGIFGYPKDQALKVAIGTISSFLLENEMTVYIVIFDCKAYQLSGKLICRHCFIHMAHRQKSRCGKPA